MRKAKDLEILAKEVEISSQPQPTEVIPAANIQAAPTVEPKSTGPAMKRKNPANDDDEGFITVQKKKDKWKPIFSQIPREICHHFCLELGDEEDKNWNWLKHLSHFQELIPYDQVSNSPP
ncbi:hypothetical protein CEXT_83861 [Caerostris extrusa]|uniref:Uncharacterized protein n=1 Tax=Caerostris extrusa TaxID=172846 RepID=A0AAV4TJY1_CAEEX|nr:hypothetical protein CEXT_83861 [Caerostris extrusa]